MTEKVKIGPSTMFITNIELISLSFDFNRTYQQVKHGALLFFGRKEQSHIPNNYDGNYFVIFLVDKCAKKELGRKPTALCFVIAIIINTT